MASKATPPGLRDPLLVAAVLVAVLPSVPGVSLVGSTPAPAPAPAPSPDSGPSSYPGASWPFFTHPTHGQNPPNLLSKVFYTNDPCPMDMKCNASDYAIAEIPSVSHCRVGHFCVCWCGTQVLQRCQMELVFFMGLMPYFVQTKFNLKTLKCEQSFDCNATRGAGTARELRPESGDGEIVHLKELRFGRKQLHGLDCKKSSWAKRLEKNSEIPKVSTSFASKRVRNSTKS